MTEQSVPGVLAAYRPAQRHVVLDARHVGVEDLPESNLVTAVVRLEQTRTPWDVVEVARMLRRWLRRPDDDELRRVLGRWVREVAESFAPSGEGLGAELTLEEVEMTVAERAREWSRQLIREGREQGRVQGHREGRLELVAATLRARGIETAPDVAEDRELLGALPDDALVAAALACTDAADFRRRIRERRGLHGRSGTDEPLG